MNSSLHRGYEDDYNSADSGLRLSPGFSIIKEEEVNVRVRKEERPREKRVCRSEFIDLGNLSQASPVLRGKSSLISILSPQALQIQAKDIFLHSFYFR